MNLLKCVISSIIWAYVAGQSLRGGSEEVRERFLQEVVQGCRSLRPHRTCAGLAAVPRCMPFRSRDYCPDDQSFPLLIQRRTARFRNDPAAVFNDGYWFHTLEDKVAGYTFTASEGLRAPALLLCSDDVNALDSFTFPSNGFVIKATRLHSNLGVFVFNETFGGDGKATELIQGQEMTLADVKTALAATSATRFLVEEYIQPFGTTTLPTEYKFHMINGTVESISIVHNRGSPFCGCFAEVDQQWNRLDSYGCFKPSGTAQANGQCFAIDFAEGATDAFPMKGMNLCGTDNFPRPDPCQINDMVTVAERISRRVGAYMRVDMFIAADDQIVVQEYTPNHVNGLRHCSARRNPSGCIDSCFLGRAWSTSGNAFYGGPMTPIPNAVDLWRNATTASGQCAVALSQQPQMWETTCVRLPPQCSRITPDVGGMANLTNVGSVRFGANAFSENTVVCVNRTLSETLDQNLRDSTRNINIQDRLPHHVQLTANNDPRPGTSSTVSITVSRNLADTIDNGATIEAYVLIDNDLNPATPPVYRVVSGILLPPSSTDPPGTLPSVSLQLPDTAYIPDGAGNFIATITLAATSPINCGIVSPSGGQASLENTASAQFGVGVFVDESEVCITKTNEPTIAAIFNASTRFTNLQAKLNYEVNIISQLRPVNGSENAIVTLNVPEFLANTTQHGASVVPFIMIDHDPDDPDLDFIQAVGTFNAEDRTLTFQLDTTSFLPNIGNNAPRFTSVITLGAVSPLGCDIIKPNGGTADRKGVGSVTFDEDAFSRNSEVCIEPSTNQALIDQLLSDARNPDANVQGTAPNVVNITSQLPPADSSSVSLDVPPNLVELTRRGAQISAFYLFDQDNDPTTPPRFVEVLATFNTNTGRASFVLPPGAYIVNPEGEYEAAIILAGTSPDGCEILGPEGGTASTRGVGSATFQPGAFGLQSEVCVRTSNDTLSQQYFNNTVNSTGLNVQERLAYDVLITSAVRPNPATRTNVTINVPPELAALTRNGADVVGFVLVDEDNDPNTPPTFRQILGVYNEKATTSVSFDLPPGAFFPPATEGQPFNATITLAAVSPPQCEIIGPGGGTTTLENVSSATFSPNIFSNKSEVCITSGNDPVVASLFESSTSSLNLAGPTSPQINITSQFAPEPNSTVRVTVDVPNELNGTIDNGANITAFVLVDDDNDPSTPPRFVPVQGTYDSSTGTFAFDLPSNSFRPDGNGRFTSTIILGSILEPGCSIIGPTGGTSSLAGVASASFPPGAYTDDSGVCIVPGGPPGPIFREATSTLNIQDTLPQRVNITSQLRPALGNPANVTLNVTPEIASAAVNGGSIRALVLVESGNPAEPLTYSIVSGTFDEATGTFTFPIGSNAFVPDGSGGFMSTVTLITTAPRGCDIVRPTGGMVDLEDVASAAFNASVFSSDTQVCIFTSNLPEIQTSFDQSTAEINIQTETPFELNIEASRPLAPGSSSVVTIQVPPNLADDIQDGATIFAFPRTDSDNDPSTPPVFTQITGVFNPTTLQYSFELPASNYLPSTNQTFISTVILASVSPEGCEIIGPNAGSVTRDFASASIRSNTFTEPTEVCLLNGTDPAITRSFSTIVDTFNLENQLPYHVNLTANSAPNQETNVRFNLTVPDDLARTAADGATIEVFALIDQDNTTSTPPVFQIISGTYDVNTSSVVFELPASALHLEGNIWTAVVTLGAVPLPTNAPSVSARPTVTGSLAPSVSSQPSASSIPSFQPSSTPSTSPVPSASPSQSPSVSASPSNVPSSSPSRSPAPSLSPSSVPSSTPSLAPSLSQFPSTAPTRTGCTTITAAGGGVASLDGNITARYDGSAYNVDSEVCIVITAEDEIRSLFNDSARVFRPIASLPYEFRIGTEALPVGGHNITVNVPAFFAAMVNATIDVEVFVAVNTADGGRQLLRLILSRYDRETQTVTFNVPPETYTSPPSGSSMAGGFSNELVFTLAITPGVDQCAGDETCDDPFQNTTCLAASLQCPVDDGPQGTGCTNPIRSFQRPENGISNLGVVFETQNGDRIFAAAAGTVEFTGSLSVFGGRGKSLILRHTEGSATLYAGLESVTVSQGADVIPRTQLGTAMPGGLYFEYIPNGMLYRTKFRINPLPCIGLVAEGSVVVGDNGNFADDSFEIIIDGISIGQTPIGARGINFAISNLRPGRHTLVIRTVFAPDGVGTYYIRLNEGIFFVDSRTNAFTGFNTTFRSTPVNIGQLGCMPTRTPPHDPFSYIACRYGVETYSFFVPENRTTADGAVTVSTSPAVSTPSTRRRRLPGSDPLSDQTISSSYSGLDFLKPLRNFFTGDGYL